MLTHSTLLRREELDEGRYAESLIERARTLGMELGGFPDGLRALLLRQCRAYSGGSGSVRRETAARLSESILFTLGVRLRELPQPLDALAWLANGSVEDCWREGRARVDAAVRAAELFYRCALPKMPPLGNHCFQSTFRDGIEAFFREYNPEYAAHERVITADYPVLYPPDGFRGIDFLRRYLDRWQRENRVLNLLPIKSVRQSLSLYALRHQLTPGELNENLCLIALAGTDDALLHSSMARKSAASADLAAIRRDYAAEIAHARQVLRGGE